MSWQNLEVLEVIFGSRHAQITTILPINKAGRGVGGLVYRIPHLLEVLINDVCVKYQTKQILNDGIHHFVRRP